MEFQIISVFVYFKLRFFKSLNWASVIIVTGIVGIVRGTRKKSSFEFQLNGNILNKEVFFVISMVPLNGRTKNQKT